MRSVRLQPALLPLVLLVLLVVLLVLLVVLLVLLVVLLALLLLLTARTALFFLSERQETFCSCEDRNFLRAFDLFNHGERAHPNFERSAWVGRRNIYLFFCIVVVGDVII